MKDLETVRPSVYIYNWGTARDRARSISIVKIKRPKVESRRRTRSSRLSLLAANIGRKLC